MAALPTNYVPGQPVGSSDINAITGAINDVVAGNTQITLTNPLVNGYTEGIVKIGLVGSSCTLDLTNGTVLSITLTASTPCVITMPPTVMGKNFILYVRQAVGTGGYGYPVFPATVRWPNGTNPTPTLAPNRLDIYTFFNDGIGWYGSYQQNYFAGDQDLALPTQEVAVPIASNASYPVLQPIRRALLGRRG